MRQCAGVRLDLLSGLGLRAVRVRQVCEMMAGVASLRVRRVQPHCNTRS
jgi:hypothetical protein